MKHIKTILAAVFGVAVLACGYLAKQAGRDKKKRNLYIAGAVVAAVAIPVVIFFDKVKTFVLTHVTTKK